MKLYGVFGKGSGKVGNSVWGISGGVQIVRPYNPNVSNPNTAAQVAQRAKLKLMSQLAATLALAIAFKKQGLVSSRNQFVSANIGLASYDNESAEVKLLALDLTGSQIGLPDLAKPTLSAKTLSVALSSAAAKNIKRVAFFVYAITEKDKLQYVASKIVTEAGEGRTFPTTIAVEDGNYVVYAYGIIDNNTKATIRYQEYIASGLTFGANVNVLSVFGSGDYTFTKTVAAKN